MVILQSYPTNVLNQPTSKIHFIGQLEDSNVIGDYTVIIGRMLDCLHRVDPYVSKRGVGV